MRNPYEDDHSPIEDDRERCCACGDTFEPEETLAFVGTDRTPIHPQCAALCSGCSELGVAKDMLRIGASHFVHYDCLADPKVIYEQAQAQQDAEQRDEFNRFRR